MFGYVVIYLVVLVVFLVALNYGFVFGESLEGPTPSATSLPTPTSPADSQSPSPSPSASPSPTCINEQIAIQQLRQQNAQLAQQLFQSYGELGMQSQRLQPLIQILLQTTQEEGKAAEKERVRLEGIRGAAPPTPNREDGKK